VVLGAGGDYLIILSLVTSHEMNAKKRRLNRISFAATFSQTPHNN